MRATVLATSFPAPTPLLPLVSVTVTKENLTSASVGKTNGCVGRGLLLLLLPSPAISLGFTIVGESFAYVTVFNPTIEVVTFRLRGWAAEWSRQLSGCVRLKPRRRGWSSSWRLQDLSDSTVTLHPSRAQVASRGPYMMTGRKAPPINQPANPGCLSQETTRKSQQLYSKGFSTWTRPLPPPPLPSGDSSFE